MKVTKHEKENTSSLIRRFSKNVKESGILSEARAKQFYKTPKNKRQKKVAALWREKIRGLRKQLLKMGEIQRNQKIDPERIRKEFQQHD